ncbi:MAG: methyl-accepting chemotaxis protein [Actinobacteria bacterium]|nr:methyl-accepting chemotaxis protein [Actinomycetota bacterium]
MEMPTETGFSERFSERVVPQWYKDLNAAHRPLVIGFTILVVAFPLYAVALLAAFDMSEASRQLERLLAQPTADVAAIESAAGEYHAAEGRFTVSVVIAIFYSLIVTNGMTWLSTAVSRGPLVRLHNVLGRIAKGDLTPVVVRESKSQVGDIQEAVSKLLAAFNAVIWRIGESAGELRQALDELSQNSESASIAIGDVAQSVSSISEGAAKQVDLVSRAVKGVAEIEQRINLAAEGASGASERSGRAELLTEEGAERALGLRHAMEEVRHTSSSTARMVAALDEKSGDIDEIVAAITDIASQTNLLALNAAIEAARAGEQGKGFAVVAEEVRKLAENAQLSAGDIAGLIDQIQAQTADAVRAMEAGTARVEAGVDAVGRNHGAFTEIADAVRAFHESTTDIARLAHEIALDGASVREQIEEVAAIAQQSSASTEEVSASTEQTAAAAEEVTAAADRVGSTARELRELAERFTLAMSAAPATVGESGEAQS